MKPEIRINDGNWKLDENYDGLDLIDIFSCVTAAIDHNMIATFMVESNLKKISPVMDFKHDFTSIMPELIGLYRSIYRRASDECTLFFYEINVKFYFDFGTLDSNIVKVAMEDKSGVQIYQMYASVLMTDIQNVLTKFDTILSDFFPSACEIFKREGYLINTVD